MKHISELLEQVLDEIKPVEPSIAISILSLIEDRNDWNNFLKDMEGKDENV